MQIWKTNARWFQLFKSVGKFIINERGKALAVQGNRDADNANIIVENKNGNINQQWEVGYADEITLEFGKGEFNPEFGLFVERSFAVACE